jgi:xanthine dehydrogenase YagT iron-sulfur-binding subunit
MTDHGPGDDTPLDAKEAALMERLGKPGATRRDFLKMLAVVGISLPAAQALLGCESSAAALTTGSQAATATGGAAVSLTINGTPRHLALDPRVTLLDALRETLHLTGTKKGCDQGQCGACTVIVDGRRTLSCLTLAVMHEGSSVTTIEGLGTPERLHAMQAAFVKHDGYQCGYCTPGQICSAVAVLDEIKAGVPSHVTGDLAAGVTRSDAELQERMSGNICRCGAYAHIIAAINDVAGRTA